MKLNRDLWNSFSTYLYFDAGLSQNPDAQTADRSRFNKLCDYFEGVEYNRENFAIFLQELQLEGKANATLNNMIKIAHHVNVFLKLEDFAKRKYFREPKRVPKDVLTSDEIKMIADVKIPYKTHREYINQRNKALILLLGINICRPNEAFNLLWEDLGSTAKHGKILYRDTKNGDDREAAVFKIVLDEILSLPRLSKYVFVSYRGKKLRSGEVTLDIKRRAKVCGIKKNVYARLLRPSGITEYLERGMEIADVADLAGHRDPRTTMRYKHSTLDHQYKAMKVHPLLKQEQTWDEQTEEVNKSLNKIVDKTKYKVIMEEDKKTGELMIVIVPNSPVEK